MWCPRHGASCLQLCLRCEGLGAPTSHTGVAQTLWLGKADRDGKIQEATAMVLVKRRGRRNLVKPKKQQNKNPERESLR